MENKQENKQENNAPIKKIKEKLKTEVKLTSQVAFNLTVSALSFIVAFAVRDFFIAVFEKHIESGDGLFYKGLYAVVVFILALAIIQIFSYITGTRYQIKS